MYLSVQIIILFFIFVFGAILGSYLNVVILRHNTGLSSKRSICFSCGKILSPGELIPIFSYLWQMGRCIKCKTKISSQYFWVELIFGLVAVILFIFTRDYILFLWLFKYILLLGLFAILTCTFVYDLRHKIMPDKWTFWAFVLAVIYTTLFNLGGLGQALFASVIVGLPLLLINLITQGRGMGWGDVKFAPVMGALLGVSGGLAALTISFWLGAIWAVYLLIRYSKKINRKSELPFGPFLILSTFLVFIFNINLGIILAWFSNLLI